MSKSPTEKLGFTGFDSTSSKSKENLMISKFSDPKETTRKDFSRRNSAMKRDTDL
jgi:hypothetical protein